MLPLPEVIERYQTDLIEVKINEMVPNEEFDDPKDLEENKNKNSKEANRESVEIDEELGDIDEYEVEGVIVKRYSGKNTQFLVKWANYEYWESSWVMMADCSELVKKMGNAKEMKEFRVLYERAIKNKSEKNVLGSKGALKTELFKLAKSIIDEFD